MRFEETHLSGAFLVEIERLEDERGFFARSWCREEVAGHGLIANIDQVSLSYNRHARTLRGMHYQAEPFPETKLVSCARGGAYDVIIDLRRRSPTFLGWYAVELSANDGRAIYVPAGLAHGYVTLESDTILQYHIASSYRRELARGVRWNDPAFGVRWPFDSDLVLSDRDRNYEPFDPGQDGFGADHQAHP